MTSSTESRYHRLKFTVESVKEEIESNYLIKIKRVLLQNQYGRYLTYRVTAMDDGIYYLVTLSDILHPNVFEFNRAATLINFLGGVGFTIRNIVPTRTDLLVVEFELHGTKNGYALFRGLDSAEPKPFDFSLEKVKGIGKSLATFHTHTTEYDINLYDGPQQIFNNYIDLLHSEYPEHKAQLTALTTHVLEKLDELSLPTDPTPEFGLIHGYYLCSALIYSGEHVFPESFDSAHTNWKYIDLSIAELGLKLSPQKNQDELIRALYAGYESVRSLSEWETQNKEFLDMYALLLMLGYRTMVNQEVSVKFLENMVSSMLRELKNMAEQI
ncbi:MAG: hypothetical protein ACXAD7_00710 [Candidatus Kariarchaeaceae archaeon]|jgi:Ser/Thr protein kinase RdoA (MazF antagonist)